MEITAKGNIFTTVSKDGQRTLQKIIVDTLAEAARRHIIQSFDNSVRLAALVGQRPDQEALKAIYRSIKVNVVSVDPCKLEAKFQDDYSHWYGGEELPQEIADVLQETIESSLNTWFNTPEPGQIIVEALVAI